MSYRRGVAPIGSDFNAYRPSWSPDKQKIAFASYDTGGIFVMSVDGSGQTRLTQGNDGHPAWSPDGRQIAFQRAVTGNSSEIYVMNPDGTGQTGLTHDANDRRIRGLVARWEADRLHEDADDHDVRDLRHERRRFWPAEPHEQPCQQLVPVLAMSRSPIGTSQELAPVGRGGSCN